MVSQTLVHALAAVACLASYGPADAAVRLWVVDDGLRINPRTAKALEDSEIYPEGLRVKSGYRDHNWVFSAAAKQVSLTGARNEVLALQLQIESAMPLANVNVTVSDLKRPAPFPVKGSVRLFKEWYVEVKQPSHGGTTAVGFDCLGPGWYPDALIPLDKQVKPEFGMPFDIPDRTNAVPDQTVQAVWVDVHVPRDQKPGV